MRAKLIKLGIYEIAKTGKMKVPVRFYATPSMKKIIEKDRALEQAVNVAQLPGIQKASLIMPDAHQGYGFPIGGVAAFSTQDGLITPGGIGYDINCGVRLLQTNLTKEDVVPKVKELLNTVFDIIPCGVGSESKLRLSDSELDDVLNTGLKWTLKNKYATEHDVEHCEENGHMKTADATKVSPRAHKRGRRQLGTLGAGNHFFEIQWVDKVFDKDIAKKFGLKEGQVVVMIHSGSRGLGHQVCSDFLRRMEEEQPKIVASLPDRELIYAPAQSKLAKDYLRAMSAAANFGWCNRQLMVYGARKAFKKVLGSKVQLKTIYDVAHNIAKVEEYVIDGKKKEVYVHRKGATRAFGPGHKEIPLAYRTTGQPIIVPGSMGTSSYVLVGTDKARNETFASTPHGAGRVMSRKEAKRRFTVDGTIKELAKHKIYIKARSHRGIVEEAPGVYKDIDEVMKVAHEVGIGKLVARVKPMGVVKG